MPKNVATHQRWARGHHAESFTLMLEDVPQPQFSEHVRQNTPQSVMSSTKVTSRILGWCRTMEVYRYMKN